MIKKSKELLVLVIILLAGQMGANAKTVKALFIGNSYTHQNDLPNMIKQYALSLDDTLYYEQITPGGFTFQGHNTHAPTLSLINEGGWDYVILQEQSQIPSFPDPQVESLLYPYATALVDKIKLANPCTKVVFYQTWGRENGDAANCASFPPLCTYNGMDSMLRLRYNIMAEDNNAWLSPVGDAWKEMRTLYPEVDLYTSDESHPSFAGSYVAAATFYSILFDNDPVTSNYNGSLSTAIADQIKEVVREVVFLNKEHYTQYDPLPNASFSELRMDDLIFQFVIEDYNESFTYDWDFDDGTTFTGENPIHEFPYTVQFFDVKLRVTDTCGFYNEQILEVDAFFEGIDQAELNKRVNVFPNPVTDYLNVKIDDSPNKIYNINIYSVDGRLVHSMSNVNITFPIPINELPQGNYLLSVFDKKESFRKIFIKQ